MEIFTVKELRVKAKALKIKGIYTMRKAELISAIEQVEKAAHTVFEPVAEKQSKGYAEKSADLLTPEFSAANIKASYPCFSDPAVQRIYRNLKFIRCIYRTYLFCKLYCLHLVLIFILFIF